MREAMVKEKKKIKSFINGDIDRGDGHFPSGDDNSTLENLLFLRMLYLE